MPKAFVFVATPQGCHQKFIPTERSTQGRGCGCGHLPGRSPSHQVAVAQIPLHSPLFLVDCSAPFWLCGKLPWHPGFVSSLDELEKPHLPFYAHIFFSSMVAAGVLGRALVHLQFKCAPFSRKFLGCKLGPCLRVSIHAQTS